jgi:hypothetical protein
MRKFLFALFAMLFLVGSSAGIVAAQDDDATPPDEDVDSSQVEDATPEDDEDTDSGDTGDGETNPVNPQIGDTVTLYSTQGDPQVTFTVTDAFRDWDEYDEFDEPERGTSYLAVEISVEVVSEDAYELDPYRFGLQDGQGFFYGNSYASPVEGAETEVLSEAVTLNGGDTWEGAVIFEVYDDQTLGSLFWSESGILLTVADLSEV